jgi:endonuclease III
MLHGQRCCYFRNPACGRCPLLDLCPTGQRRMAPDKVTDDSQASDQTLAVTAEVSLDRNSLARS